MYAQQFIKGFYKIQDFLSEEQILDIGNFVYQYAKFSKVYFKIEKIDKENKTIIIQVKQDKIHTNNDYFTYKELTEIGKKVFSDFFKDYITHINPITYKAPPADFVTGKWIAEQMKEKKIGAKFLAFDLGLSQSELSALINEHREMGIRTKGLFYYYFKSL